MAPPTQYKPIQPAPLKVAKSGTSSGTGRVNGEKHAKRVKAVTQACHTCRRYKAKCDGLRPRCTSCKTKNKPCGYEGEEGQSRQEAMKSRLEALERLVTALQQKSPEEAEALLQRIRNADDIVSLSSAASSDSGERNIPGLHRNDSTSPSMGGSLSDSWTSPSSVPTVSTDIIKRALQSASPSGDESSEGGMQLVSDSGSATARLRVDHSAYLIRFVLPNADATRAALNSFYSSSGKLFHVFSQQDMDRFFTIVFGYDGRPNYSQKMAICCLCSVAAVGIQYNPDDFEKGSEHIFYEVARRYFVDVLEESSLDAIKVCAMLAFFNVMNKATISLAWVELGMSMSRQFGLNTSILLRDEQNDHMIDYRKTWRTLMFFSSWLSSTLGYISGSTGSDFQKFVPIADVEPYYPLQVTETVQREMTKISLLKAEILRMQLEFQDLPRLTVVANEYLEKWHEKLPVEVQLANLANPGLDDTVRRSIYHVHLLYLGAMQLLYRWIAARLIQTTTVNGREVIVPSESVPEEDRKLLKHVSQGLVAAKHSARLLALLHGERGIFQRCWLVIFQSHTSCVVILHSVAQKQVHGFPVSSWAPDLKLAQLCLDTLEFCGRIDPVALRFHVRLSAIFKSLTAALPSNDNQTTRQRTEDWVTMPPDFPPIPGAAGVNNSAGTPLVDPEQLEEPDPEYLLTMPKNAKERVVVLSHSLLSALCRPWGGDEAGPTGTACAQGKSSVATVVKEKAVDEEDIPASSATFRWDHTGHLGSRGMSKLAKELGLTKSTDESGLGSCSTSEVNLGSDCRFLDSEDPHGWQTAPEYIDMSQY
ncbi:hypothetical protein GE21DRAFT_7520 [Neurospora crassa]|uniref:Zn(2)-C6 fungal-type domain-containing protein n=1 Tax=Neurospora crassa (strain ATCC 24698 / 74-OR23-1A / CBS 708.71 / DSM 1257 / FGSC 987) TaxID=367110 RepID=Q7S808_NEUCR|nr:hypothetical protein NCU01097 [Neurospora crassa OR74A]EAA32473.1 hypothetical protein NCU01097 [Neurospora crassa OR74A]KHE88279.1 hypothetical protein GE21DRAFT_7520 [Neurospora crassa]|eukprot:XP_961709.1 hypothetical protein NCU01097 [Neurospora crassa OR74A]